MNRAKSMLERIDRTSLITAIETLCLELEGKARHGGVLAIATVYPDTGGGGVNFESTSIGNPGLKFGRYAKNASEKINRLFERRTDGNDEVAASVSADKKLGTYGGCIYFRNEQTGIDEEVFISFSGAPPEIDEALAFVIGEKLGLQTPEYENPLIPRVRELLKELI